MDGVSGRRVSMMGRLFVLATVMMLGRFTVMAGGMRMNVQMPSYGDQLLSSTCDILSVWGVIPFITVSNTAHHPLIVTEFKHFDGNKFPLFELFALGRV
jgi:hypothetical protein